MTDIFKIINELGINGNFLKFIYLILLISLLYKPINSFWYDFNRNKKEMSFKFKSLGNELDSSTKNSHWGSFGIFWNLIKFFLK